MTTIASSTFTGADNTTLATLDSAFAFAFGTAAACHVLSNKLRYTTMASSAKYTHSATPPSADYDVYADVPVSSVSGTGAAQASVLGRQSTTVATGYNLMLRCPENELRLYRVVAGTSVLVGTATGVSVTNGATVGIRLRMVGSQISAYLNGSTTPSINYTDATPITAAGKAGLGIYRSDTGSTLLEMDNWGAETIGADSTAPTLTSPTASATGSTTATGGVTTDTAEGTLYYLTSANATETAATVKAGASQAITTSGAKTVSLTGLTASTSYYLHFCHRDAAGNDSAVSTSPQFTTSAGAGVVKGVEFTLYNGSTAQASLTGITALWWDATTPSGAPDYETAIEATDAAGLLSIDLNAVTSLSVGSNGFLLLYKANATYQDSLAFAGQVPVSDIS